MIRLAESKFLTQTAKGLLSSEGDATEVEKKEEFSFITPESMEALRQRHQFFSYLIDPNNIAIYLEKMPHH